MDTRPPLSSFQGAAPVDTRAPLSSFYSKPQTTDSTGTQVADGLAQGAINFAQNLGGGIFSQLWGQMKERAGSMAQSYQDVKSGAINPLHGATQVVGQGAGAIGDLIGGALSTGGKAVMGVGDIVAPGATDSARKLGAGILTSPLGQGALKALSAGSAAWDKFSKENPQTAKDISSVVNVGMLLPIGEGANALKKGAQDIAATGKSAVSGLETVAKGVASGTEAMGKGLVSDIGKGVDALGQTKAGSVVGGAIENLSQGVSRSAETLAQTAEKRAATALLPEQQRIAIQNHIPKDVVTRVVTSAPETKALYEKMISGVEKRMGDVRSTFQPKEVAGQELVDTADRIAGKMRATGKKLGDTKTSLKGQSLDVAPVKDEVFKKMEDMGVEVGDKGKLSFQKGVPPAPDELEILQKVYDIVSGEKPIDAINADRLRQALFENTNVARQPLSSNAMRIASDFRTSLTDAINTVNPEYGKLASDYAQSRRALEDFTKLLNYKGSIDDLSGKGLKAGEVAMRILGNAADRPQSVIDGLLAEAERLGVKGKSDVNDLINFADQLETTVGSTQTRSLAGGVEKGILGAAKKLPVIGDVISGVQSMAEPSAEQKLRAFRKLLEEGAAPATGDLTSSASKASVGDTMKPKTFQEWTAENAVRNKQKTTLDAGLYEVTDASGKTEIKHLSSDEAQKTVEQMMALGEDGPVSNLKIVNKVDSPGFDTNKPTGEWSKAEIAQYEKYRDTVSEEAMKLIDKPLSKWVSSDFDKFNAMRPRSFAERNAARVQGGFAAKADIKDSTSKGVGYKPSPDYVIAPEEIAKMTDNEAIAEIKTLRAELQKLEEPYVGVKFPNQVDNLSREINDTIANLQNHLYGGKAKSSSAEAAKKARYDALTSRIEIAQKKSIGMGDSSALESTLSELEKKAASKLPAKSSSDAVAKEIIKGLDRETRIEIDDILKEKYGFVAPSERNKLTVDWIKEKMGYAPPKTRVGKKK